MAAPLAAPVHAERRLADLSRAAMAPAREWGALRGYLERYRFSLDVTGALKHLEAVRDCHRLMELYEQFFPREYAASRLPTLPYETSPWTAAEWEFFELVNERLFPLELDSMLDTDERRMSIQSYPRSIDWDETPLEYFVPGMQFLIVLWMQVEGEYGTFEQPDKLPGLDAAVQEVFANGPDLTEIGTARLERACQRLRTPLRYLAEAFDIVAHQTECVYWDCDLGEYYGEIEAYWQADHMEWLAGQWKRFREMDAHLDELLAWLQGPDGVGNMKKALRLLRKCSRERVSVLGRTLVEVFSEDGEDEDDEGDE